MKPLPLTMPLMRFTGNRNTSSTSSKIDPFWEIRGVHAQTNQFGREGQLEFGEGKAEGSLGHRNLVFPG